MKAVAGEGDESPDVAGYHTAHPDFPHQSTGEQLFAESQFEAYRKLGEHIVQTALGRLRCKPCEREKYFEELQDAWYPPSERVDRLSSKHAERFTDLTLDLADKDSLSFLDEQIFPGWKENGNGSRWERTAVLRCSALIEFMETVFADLNLDSRGEKEHPHNLYWLRIFEHWVQQPVFQETWRNTRTIKRNRIFDRSPTHS